MAEPNNSNPNRPTQSPSPFVTPTPRTPLPSSSILSSFVTPQQFRQRKEQIDAKYSKYSSEKSQIDLENSEQKAAVLNTVEENNFESNFTQENENNENPNEINENIDLEPNSNSQQTNPNFNNLDENERQKQYDFHMIQMRNENELLKMQLSQQNSRLSQLQYEQAFFHQQQSSQPSTSINSNVLKGIAKPDTFEGDVKSDPDTWIAQMRTYLSLQCIPPMIQCVYASTFMKQQASTWFNTLPPNERSKLVDFEALAAMVLVRFRPVDIVGQARRQLDRLTQTGSVSAFNQKFMSIIQLIPTMHKEERISSYRKKLKYEIQDRMVTNVYYQLSDIMTAAMATDEFLYEFKLTTKNNNRHHSNSFKQRTEAAAAPQSVSVNNVKINSATPTNSNDQPENLGPEVPFNFTLPAPMDEAEKQRCRANRLCFRCRQPGHQGINCTVFTSRPNSRLRPSTEISSKKY